MAWKKIICEALSFVHSMIMLLFLVLCNDIWCIQTASHWCEQVHFEGRLLACRMKERAPDAIAQQFIIKQDVNLKETIVLTPDASTISTTIEIIGDVLKNIEESIKEISLTADYVKLAGGISTLVFLSALGRVMTLPLLLVIAHVSAFTVPFVYVKNQEKIDQILQNSMEATEIFLEKNFQLKVKLQ